MKYLLSIVVILFTLALISPVKACFVVNIVSNYSYVVLSEAGNGLINVALFLRGLV